MARRHWQAANLGDGTGLSFAGTGCEWLELHKDWSTQVISGKAHIRKGVLYVDSTENVEIEVRAYNPTIARYTISYDFGNRCLKRVNGEGKVGDTLHVETPEINGYVYDESSNTSEFVLQDGSRFYRVNHKSAKPREKPVRIQPFDDRQKIHGKV